MQSSRLRVHGFLCSCDWFEEEAAHQPEVVDGEAGGVAASEAHLEWGKGSAGGVVERQRGGPLPRFADDRVALDRRDGGAGRPRVRAETPPLRSYIRARPPPARLERIGRARGAAHSLLSEAMGETQTLRERPPAPIAAPYVSAVSVFTISSDGLGHAYRRVPNGCIDLAYALGTPSVAVLGPGSRHSVAQLEPGTTMIGLRFHPGVGAPILGASAAELACPDLGLDDVWGGQARFLAERLSDAGSPENAASLLETEVGLWAADRAAADALMLAMLEILRRRPRVDIDDVAVELSLSPRQLGRRSVAAFGYSPKRLQRIIRLQRFLAYDAAFSADGMSLNRLAWAAGYADQPHLTRESVAITGLAPKQLLVSRDRDCAENHTHVAKFVPFMRAPTEPMAA